MIVKNDANTYPDEAIMEEQPKKFVRDNLFSNFRQEKNFAFRSSLSTLQPELPHCNQGKTRTLPKPLQNKTSF
jgi:hypothetical protein